MMSWSTLVELADLQSSMEPEASARPRCANALEPAEPVRRHERENPGELIHIAELGHR
jgi:hypothetical protein